MIRTYYFVVVVIISTPTYDLGMMLYRMYIILMDGDDGIPAGRPLTARKEDVSICWCGGFVTESYDVKTYRSSGQHTSTE